MNQISHEIQRLNITFFHLIDVVFGVVAVATKTAFRCLGSEHLLALSTICLLGCLACVWTFVCLALACLNISLPFIQLLLIVQGTFVSYLNSH